MRTAIHAGRGVALALTTGLLLSTATADSLETGAAPDGLSAREIYGRVIENRFRAFMQESRLISADRTGRAQESRFNMRWKDFRDGHGKPTRGVLSKTLVKYTHPFDLRFSGYLIQANHQRVNDQFVYYPSRRRVVRVNLRSEAVYGTDFSFEDVIPREAEDFTYRRLSDGIFRDIPVYVVELFPNDFADSEYAKIRVSVDKQHDVVVRARYWDAAGVEVKEFIAEPGAIKEFDGVWVPMEATMRNLRLDSYTTLVVSRLVPNPEFDKDAFDLGRLESH
jgi:hypothetical protein